MSENSLPNYLRSGAVVPYGDTFLIVGGLNGPAYYNDSDEIWQFNPDDETWTVREERMSIPRAGHFAGLVDATRYNCL